MNERIRWIDYAKGIAVGLVLVGHFVPLRSLQIFIYSFHMPLFFFLAGVTFRNQQPNFRTFTKKKFMQIMVPYFIFVIPMFIMKCVQDIHVGNMKLLVKHFIGIFLCWKGTSLYSGVWFLPCMFIVYVLAWGGVQLQNVSQRISGTVIVAIIGYSLGKLNITFPFGADTALIAVSFFSMGMLLRKYEKSVSKKHILLYIITAVSSAMNFILCGRRVEMYSCDYGNIVLFLIASYSGIVGTIALSKNIADNKSLEKMGKSAMYLYGAQLVPLSIYRGIHIDGNITRIVIGFLTAILIGRILLVIQPLYDRLYIRCCEKLK